MTNVRNILYGKTPSGRVEIVLRIDYRRFFSLVNLIYLMSWPFGVDALRPLSCYVRNCN